MKILLIVGVAVVALIVVVVLRGFLLPVKHKAQVSAKFTQQPDALWKTITGVEGFPTWRKDVKAVAILSSPGERLSWREESKNGAMTYQIIESVAPTKLVSRIADKNQPFGGSWTYEISASNGGGSQLTITENGEVYNPIFRFVSKFIMGHTATIEQYLKYLKEKVSRSSSN